MRTVNLDTLEVEEIKRKNIYYVYVLIENGIWNYEEGHNVEVYTKFEDAFKAYKNKTREANRRMKSWLEEEQIQFFEETDKTEEIANFVICDCDDYNRFHYQAWIEKQEVR